MVNELYLCQNTSFESIKKFFVLNLITYRPKLKGLFEIHEKSNYHEIPMPVDGDLNLDLREVHGT